MPGSVSLVGSRIMALLSTPVVNRGVTRRLQGQWMTGMACGALGKQSRPVTSFAAVLGRGGADGSGKGGNNGGSGGKGGPNEGPHDGSGSSWRRAAVFGLAGGLLLCGEGAAWAAKHEEPVVASPPGELTVEKVTELLIQLAGPILANLGFSGCVGAAAGFALKKVGQLVALCVGLAFLFVQGLAYTGFITVNWSHVHDTVHDVLDVNKDGKVDAEDFKPMLTNGIAALSQGVPSVGGFLAGFMLAIRSF